jgi:predicted lipid-binding transport protein (Tim44 family)
VPRAGAKASTSKVSARGATRTRSAAPSGVPSPTARASGFVIALVTAFLGGLLVEEAIGGMSGAAAVGQVIGGLLLIALAVFVGVLVLFPAYVRDVIARRRQRRR